MMSSAAPAPPQKSNIIKASIRVSFDDANNEDYALFGSDFDLSQISWVRIGYNDDEKVDISLNGNTLPISRPGDFDIEIGLNRLTDGNMMFTNTRLLECDFSDVDISQLASCQYMFAGTLIRESPMRELNMPLSPNSCAGMFSYCDNLELAPVLSAKVVPDFCYSRLFYGCTNLAYVRLLATEITATSLSDWLTDASAIGTLVKNADATWESPYIPEEWTVITTEDELKPPSGLEYPIVLRFDYYGYDDNYGEWVYKRTPDEYSRNLYSFLCDVASEYDEVDGMYVTESILRTLGIAIFIEGQKCFEFHNTKEGFIYILDDEDEAANWPELYDDGTLLKIDN
jgi:hypothetical protein